MTAMASVPNEPTPQTAAAQSIRRSRRVIPLTLPNTTTSAGWELSVATGSEANQDIHLVVESHRHVAFPGVCKTNSGKLLVVFRDGLTHAGGKQPTDGRAMMTKSTDLGKTWSEPWLIYDDPAVDDRNSALLCTTDGQIVHVWNKYFEGKDLGVYLAVSQDEGESWSSPVQIGESPFLRTRNAPIEVKTTARHSEWLIPLYDCMSTLKAAYVGVFHPETGRSEVYPVSQPGDRNISDEWALAQASDGRLVALIRSNWDPVLWQAESRDQGRTWQHLRPSNIPSQFTPPDLIRLADGRLLVTFSFRERCNERQAISADNGETWQVFSSIDVYDANLRGDRSYPASVQLDDNMVGTVLYETLPAPQGGRIWFARTRISNFTDASNKPVLLTESRDDDVPVLLSLSDTHSQSITVSTEYRFSGSFGQPLNGIELVMQNDAARLRAGYWMGGGRDATNLVQITWENDSQEEVLLRQEATSLFNDGNNHRISLTYSEGQAALAIDGELQAYTTVPDAPHPWLQAGVSARRVGVVLFGVEVD